MTGVGCARPDVATRRCQASCSSTGEAHATWWTVPAPCSGRARRAGRRRCSSRRAARHGPRTCVAVGLAARIRASRSSSALAAVGVDRVGARPRGSPGAPARPGSRDGCAISGSSRRLHDEQLVLEALEVREAQRVARSRLRRSRASREPLLPEVERLGARDAPDDPVDHAGAGAPARRARVLEERDVRARRRRVSSA